jgi:protein involved in polysaccharide export with SLBB domain
MQVLFINNNGGGFADYLDVEDNTTVGHFFSEKMTHEASSNYLIRVNRQPVPNDYVLQPGDRVTFTPTKIEGALRRAA